VIIETETEYFVIKQKLPMELCFIMVKEQALLLHKVIERRLVISLLAKVFSIILLFIKDHHHH
jgi:hypothetical protein